VAQVDDIIAVQWHQLLGTRCWYNRRYWRILDIGGAPAAHQFVLNDLVEEFWNRTRQICPPEWSITTAKLINLTNIHDRSATGRYDYPGDQRSIPIQLWRFPSDPRLSLRFTIWGRSDPGERVVTNGLYLSGINQSYQVNGHWNVLDETVPLEEFLKYDFSFATSPWTLRPVCITGDTSHLREAEFVDVRDAQAMPNIRSRKKRRITHPLSPTNYVYPIV